MKKTFPFLILSLLLITTACEVADDLDGYSYYSENTILYGNDNIQFREVLVSIRPYIQTGSERRYVLTDSLLNVSIRMNNTQWCRTTSLAVDTATINKYRLGDFMVTNLPVKYNVLGAYDPQKDTLTTAGEYSDLLKFHLNIEPGFYFCQVESFEIRMNDGTPYRVIPFISEMIEVTEDTRSLYLGEFDVLVYDMTAL